ncbi:MAG: DUF4038 domain-containing protein [Caldilineaceae bacterium]|nr:DUF4038 domain-containing protein [Caldilineaceae bacterium]
MTHPSNPLSPERSITINTFDPTLYIFEAAFAGEREYADPIRNLTLTVDFAGPADAHRRVDAFWDGGRTWRVRFSPPVSGEWRYTTSCSDPSAAGLHGQSGSFTAMPYAGDLPLLRHGPVSTSADGHSLAHADGTPFFWLGDTAWNGVLKAQPADWDQYLETRREQGFTAIQAVITHWRSFPEDAVGEKAFDGLESIQINPAFYQRLDAKVAAIAAHGLAPSPVLIWACTPKDPGHYLSAEDCIVLARYEVARYAAYRPLWILGGDGEYRGESAQKWIETGRAVFGAVIDADHSLAVTMHPQGINWPGDDLRDEKWLTFHSYQSGHGDNDDHLRWLQHGPPATDWAIEPVKPIINQEPNYEHHLSYHSRLLFTAFHVRRACYWSLLVSPTAGVTYGHHGIWPWMEESGVPADHAYTGESPSWRESLHAEGAEQIRHLRTLFDALNWPKLRPAQDLLVEQPGDANPNHFIAAAREEEGGPVVVYTPAGDPIRLSISLVNARWFDPRTGVWQAAGAGAGAEFAPPDNGDWLLLGEKPGA